MIDLDTISEVHSLLKPVVYHTPLTPSHHLGRLLGAEIYLKLENLQRTGSFKIRGAYSRLHPLAQENPGAKVVAASAGNHAQGVALASSLLGLRATIFMPNNAPLSKQQATLSYGAQVRLTGSCVEDGLAAAHDLGDEMTLIHPYDDERIILGQASLGMEIMDDLPDVDAVVVPVGGGGLLAGVAAAVKSRNTGIKMVGVEPSHAASLTAALQRGEPVTVETQPTLADGTRVARAGDLTLPLISRYVDEMIQVRENNISQAMLLLLERRRIVAEGAGALGLAAMLAGSLPDLKSKKVVLVISGGNVDANLIGRIIDQGLVRSGRIFRFSVNLDDRPGALAYLLNHVASTQANILHIHHDRLGKNLPPNRTRVGLELETRGFEHAAEIAGQLTDLGYTVIED